MPLINEILEDIADIKNVLPTSEVSDTELSIEDSANMRMKNLKLKGSISQDGDPTPDEPIDIEVLTGDLKINISDGEYISDLTLGTISSTNGDDVTSDTRIRTNYIKYDNQKYLIYNGLDYAIGFCYDADYNYLGRINNNTWDNSNPLKLSVLDNTTYLRFAFRIDDATTVTIDDLTSVILCNSLNSCSISLGELELCGNDTYGRDYLFRKNGKWYKHSIYNKLVLDGTESFKSAMSTYWTDEFALYSLYTSDMKLTSSGQISSITLFLCSNYFNQNTGIVLRTGTIGISMWDNSTGLAFGTNIVSLSDFKSWLQERYDNGNPVVVYYQLAEETDEEITDTTIIQQLNHLANVRLNNGTSTISSDNDKLIFDIEYYKNLDSILN